MNKKSIEKIISTILVLMLCVGFFGIISQFTNGFQEDFKTFYVTYKTEKITVKNTKRVLGVDETHRFDVVYMFEFEETESPDYSVKIISNATKESAFTFTVDGETKTYTDGIDLSKAFDLKKEASFFTFTISKDESLQTVLQKVYGGTVEVSKMSDIENPYLFTLVVSSYDESVVYNIDFGFSYFIEINPGKVVF